MGRGVDIYHGRGVDIRWLGGSKYHGQGGHKISKFPKNLNFKKIQNFPKNFNNSKIHKISKLTKFHKISKINFQNVHKIFKKFQNDKIFKISKCVYHESDIFLKIGFAEIPYIYKGLLVNLVFSIFWNNMWLNNIHKIILKNDKTIIAYH
jgi:hypothetical protein